jgi:uncharacterized protein (TIGR01244 family)
MSVRKINDKLFVGGQPTVAEFAEIVAQGIRSVINNRPDGEEPTQPGTEAEQRAAVASGLSYDHLPVTGPTITEESVRQFQAIVESAEGPVLAHCRSGTRSLTLFAIGEVLAGRMRPSEVRAFGTSHGFDLSGAERWLQRHGYEG